MTQQQWYTRKRKQRVCDGPVDNDGSFLGRCGRIFTTGGYCCNHEECRSAPGEQQTDLCGDCASHKVHLAIHLAETAVRLAETASHKLEASFDDNLETLCHKIGYVRPPEVGTWKLVTCKEVGPLFVRTITGIVLPDETSTLANGLGSLYNDQGGRKMHHVYLMKLREGPTFAAGEPSGAAATAEPSGDGQPSGAATEPSGPTPAESAEKVKQQQWAQETLTCAICFRWPMTDPVRVCANDHMYCRGCTRDDWTRCPECREPLQLGEPRNVKKTALEMLTGPYMPCVHDDCPFKGSYADLIKHENECAFTQVKCPHAGCEQMVPRNSLMEHQTACRMRPMRCRCGQGEMFEPFSDGWRHHIQQYHGTIPTMASNSFLTWKKCSHGELFMLKFSHRSRDGRPEYRLYTSSTRACCQVDVRFNRDESKLHFACIARLEHVNSEIPQGSCYRLQAPWDGLPGRIDLEIRRY